MEMSFNLIKPYLRFVRILNMTSATSYTPFIPYDARLFFVLEGCGKIKADGKLYTLEKNSALIINSGIEYHHISPAENVLYLAVNFDYTFNHFNMQTPIPPDKSDDYNESRLLEHVVFSDATPFNRVLYIKNLYPAKNILLEMEKEYNRQINMFELQLSSYMTDVLIQCFRYTASRSAVKYDESSADKIINYIHENYRRCLTNKEIAEVFHYHPNYINSIIKQHTGISLHRYMVNIRVSKAADMLTSTAANLCETATACGFYDQSHLTRCFKEIMGMTPQQYRNNMRI